MKIIFTFISLILAYNSFCQTPNINEVNQTVLSFLSQRNSRQAVKLKSSRPQQIKEIKSIEVDGHTVFHVAELEPSGYIVLSNDKSIEPIIAYSELSNFNYNSGSSFYDFLLKDLTERNTKKSSNNNKWIPEGNILKSTGSSEFQQWPEEGTTTTSGWLETNWTQGAPYNNFCPIDSLHGSNRSPVGCAGTALAQLINYYKLTDSLYLTNNDKYISYSRGINFDSDSLKYDFPSFDQINHYLSVIKTKFNKNELLNDVDKATLSLFAGVICRMDYMATGSSAAAALAFYTPGQDIFDNEDDRLGFKSVLQYRLWDSDWTEFYSKLKMNLMNGLVALINVADLDKKISAHSIICDGYNSDGFYHLNFGWNGGLSEAWYNLENDIPHGYEVINSAFINLSTDRKKMPPIQSNKCLLDFGGINLMTESNVQNLKIKNITNNTISINPRRIEACYKFSLDSNEFLSDLPQFSLEPNEEKLLYVKGTPDSIKDYNTTWILDIDEGSYYYSTDLTLTGLNIAGTLIPPGEISGIWTTQNSPYIITGDVYVKQYDSLKIMPGVDVIFNGSYSFGVPNTSKVVASGTKKDSILFSTLDSTIGWLGIDFMNADKYPNTNEPSNTNIINQNILDYCIIKNGKSFENTQRYGGAISVDDVHNFNLSITNCKLSNNKAAVGSAIRFNDITGISNITLSNTLITNNTCNYGGTVFLYKTTLVKFNNVTISHNHHNENQRSAMVYLAPRAKAEFNNSILWSPKNKEEKVIYGINQSVNDENAVVFFNYCNIDTSLYQWNLSEEDELDLYWGDGNISKDPLFSDSQNPEYCLSESSPCIDAGNPDAIFFDIEDSNNLGFALFPSLGTIRNDMGVYGGNSNCLNDTIFEEITICLGDNYNGWYMPGKYFTILTNSKQCDSVVVTDLTVYDSPNPDFIINMDTLTSNSIYSFYQWYDQNGIIEGATSKQYIIEKSGTYYLVATNQYGCTTMSSGMDLIKTGINNLQTLKLNLQIIPNPNNGIFRIRLESEKAKKCKMQIIDQLGKVHFQKEFLPSSNIHEEELRLLNLPKGIYFLNVSNGEKINTRKIILK